MIVEITIIRTKKGENSNECDIENVTDNMKRKKKSYETRRVLYCCSILDKNISN